MLSTIKFSITIGKGVDTLKKTNTLLLSYSNTLLLFCSITLLLSSSITLLLFCSITIIAEITICRFNTFAFGV